MASNDQLDISKLDNSQTEELAARIEAFYQADSGPKQQLAWSWERNHLFLDGKHWIVYDGNGKSGGQWRRMEVSAENEYIPRPTTNYVFDTYQTLKAYLIKNKPRSKVSPNTRSYRDKQSAKIGDLILEANWERLKEASNYEYAAAALVTYGTVFKKSYWDTTALMKARVPRMVQMPDPMTGGMKDVQATDPETGEPLFDELPLGDVNTCVIEPHRISIDPLATDIHNCRWIMEYSIQPLSWVQEMFDRQEEGYTGLVSEVKPEKQLSGTMRRFHELKNSSGVRNANGQAAGGGTDQMVENACVVKELYEAPSRKHPKGRMIVVASGVCLYAHDSPYEGPELGDWHPYSECRWELVPGRFWGKTALDDAVEQNKLINSIDSVIVLTRKTMAVPQKLVPMGVGIAPGQWTGRPGQEIHYRDMGGPKPEIIPGIGVDSSVFQEREMRREALKEISGAIDILKGDRPPGVTAHSALELLYEVGTGKLFPTLDRWKGFVESDQKKQLRLVSRKYKEPRPAFIAMLKAKNTELSEESIDKFIGADLHDNCNVVVEAGSNVPKLQAAKQGRLVEAASLGVLALDQPANRIEFLEQMGIAGFDDDINPDKKRAEWENDLLDNVAHSPDNKPIVLDCDVHAIHVEVHRKRMKEPSWMAADPAVQQAYMAHLQEHEQMEQMAMEAKMLQAQAMGMPAAPDANPAAPQKLQPVGKGPTKELKNAMAGDALTPASLGQGSRG